MRLTIRIADEIGAPLATLPPRLRGNVASIVLASHIAGIELCELLAVRRQLAHLGVLINQALRVNRGLFADPKSVEKAAQILTLLTKK